MSMVSYIRHIFKILFSIILICVINTLIISANNPVSKPICILVITGGHDYPIEKFDEMLKSLGENIIYS